MKIEDQHSAEKPLALQATSNSGLSVEYYVVAGAAIIEGNSITFTKVPIKSKYPVKITVVAYQWGRTIEPLYQSAEPITQEFFIRK